MSAIVLNFTDLAGTVVCQQTALNFTDLTRSDVLVSSREMGMDETNAK